MNFEIANALFGYLETLYNMNQKLIILCGIDVCDDFGGISKEILEILQDIPRIIPYSYDNNSKQLIYKNRDGLLEYQDKINYLKDAYDNILIENKEFLDNVRKIRNKYEHKMHGVKSSSSGSGSFTLFEYTFNVEFEDTLQEISITAGECIKLIKSANVLYSRIVSDISKFAYENGKHEYSYYRRITRFNFTDFNKIYDSSLIRDFGKIMRPF